MSEQKLPDIFTLQYDFIDNGAGDLMLVVESLDGAPQKPAVYFDGFFQALFKRRDDQLIPLPHVTKPVREMMSSYERILITEMDDDDEITEVYEAPIIIPENGVLPYPKELMDHTDVSEFIKEIEEE